MQSTTCQSSTAICRGFRHVGAAVLALAAGVFQAQADDRTHVAKMRTADARASDLNAQLDAAYALLAIKDRKAVIYLKRAASIAPKDARVQEQLGYSLLAEKDLAGAVAAFRAALAHNPRNEALRMQIVYVEDARGARRAAARDALVVAHGGGPRAEEGCRAYHNTSGLPDRVLPKGWFAEFYAAPEYRTTGHVAVAPVQARLGYSLIGEDILSVYASVRGTRDNRSGGSGIGSQVFYDNHLVVAGGLRLRPWEGAPVFAFVEHGAAYDLVTRGSDRWSSDTRAGVVAGSEWAMSPRACPGRVVMSLVPVADFYAEAIWYSRYDNMIGFARVRPGLRFIESDHFAVEAYALASINTDSAGLSDNRFTEAGLGLALKINAPVRLTLRAEGVHVKRIGQQAQFDRRIRLEHEIRF